MKLDEYRLHLHFAQPRWRQTTIIGRADTAHHLYFEDSGYVHVELENGRYTALIDPHTTDVRGHWFVSARPLFSSRVLVPLDGGWMEIIHEPPPEVLEGLHLIVENAEAEGLYATVLANELVACRRAALRHRSQTVSDTLDRTGVDVEEAKWVCSFIESIAETEHGMIRCGELPLIA